MMNESLTASLDSGDSNGLAFSSYFQAIRVVGQGSFGKVILGVDLDTQEELAIKVISKKRMGDEFIARVKEEARILETLHHPNVVKFKRVEETSTRVFIAMEYVPGGSLAALVKETSRPHLTEEQVAAIMKSILSGLTYIHSRKIVHRDLKPENILIGNIEDFSSVKIADFGLSSAFSLSTTNGLTQQCGTLLYMAPEFFASRTYSKQIDVWSCAVTMYFLMTRGGHPFYEPKKDTSESFKAKLINPTWYFPEQFSKISRNFCEKLSLLNPTERYSAVQALQHPFIRPSSTNEIPLTMNEQLACFVTKEQLHQKIQAMMLLKYLEQIITRKTTKSKTESAISIMTSTKRLPTELSLAAQSTMLELESSIIFDEATQSIDTTDSNIHLAERTPTNIGSNSICTSTTEKKSTSTGKQIIDYEYARLQYRNPRASFTIKKSKVLPNQSLPSQSILLHPNLNTSHLRAAKLLRGGGGGESEQCNSSNIDSNSSTSNQRLPTEPSLIFKQQPEDNNKNRNSFYQQCFSVFAGDTSPNAIGELTRFSMHPLNLPTTPIAAATATTIAIPSGSVNPQRRETTTATTSKSKQKLRRNYSERIILSVDHQLGNVVKRPISRQTSNNDVIKASTITGAITAGYTQEISRGTSESVGITNMKRRCSNATLNMNIVPSTAALNATVADPQPGIGIKQIHNSKSEKFLNNQQLIANPTVNLEYRHDLKFTSTSATSIVKKVLPESNQQQQQQQLTSFEMVSQLKYQPQIDQTSIQQRQQQQQQQQQDSSSEVMMNLQRNEEQRQQILYQSKIGEQKRQKKHQGENNPIRLSQQQLSKKSSLVEFKNSKESSQSVQIRNYLPFGEPPVPITHSRLLHSKANSHFNGIGAAAAAAAAAACNQKENTKNSLLREGVSFQQQNFIGNCGQTRVSIVPAPTGILTLQKQSIVSELQSGQRSNQEKQSTTSSSTFNQSRKSTAPGQRRIDLKNKLIESGPITTAQESNSIESQKSLNLFNVLSRKINS